MMAAVFLACINVKRVEGFVLRRVALPTQLHKASCTEKLNRYADASAYEFKQNLGRSTIV
jgi:hypothetical protein